MNHLDLMMNKLDSTNKSGYYHPKVATIKMGAVMISAGIKEVKNNLSRLLLRVKAGEDILITERGRPVARIVQEKPGNQYIREALGSLVQRGLIVLPSRSAAKVNIPPVETTGRHISEIVIEERR